MDSSALHIYICVCVYIYICIYDKLWHASFLSRCATSQWCHNGRDGVSHRQPHDYILNRLFRHRSKKKSKLRVTGLCVGNSQVTGGFPAQMASNAENDSVWWHHHVTKLISYYWTFGKGDQQSRLDHRKGPVLWGFDVNVFYSLKRCLIKVALKVIWHPAMFIWRHWKAMREANCHTHVSKEVFITYSSCE